MLPSKVVSNLDTGIATKRHTHLTAHPPTHTPIVGIRQHHTLTLASYDLGGVDANVRGTEMASWGRSQNGIQMYCCGCPLGSVLLGSNWVQKCRTLWEGTTDFLDNGYPVLTLCSPLKFKMDKFYPPLSPNSEAPFNRAYKEPHCSTVQQNTSAVSTPTRCCFNSGNRTTVLMYPQAPANPQRQNKPPS